jgi:hypothetical protein
MHNRNPLIDRLIEVEWTYALLALETEGRWARFAATDPNVAEGITNAFDLLHTAIDAALDSPMPEGLRADLLELRSALHPTKYSVDGKGLVRAVADADETGLLFSLPGGALIRSLTRARLLLQSPGPVAGPDGKVDPVTQIVLTEKAIRLLEWLSDQKRAWPRSSIALAMSPVWTNRAVVNASDELEQHDLIIDKGKKKGILISPSGRTWLAAQ